MTVDAPLPADSDAGDPTAQPLRIEVVSGTPSDDELAALIAVIGAAYAQEADEAEADEPARRTGWELSQRALRQPLRRDLGWRGVL